MATTYNQIGLAHHEMKDYSKALSFYQKLVQLKLTHLHDSHKDLAVTYNNMALAYSAIEDKLNALLFYQKNTCCSRENCIR
jgi:tetratricopeptide (TPR) repeat protein